MIYTCKHFRIEELVPQAVFEELKDKPWRLWGLLDNLFLEGIDLIWEHFAGLNDGKITIKMNDWLWGGEFQRRGFRPPPVRKGEAKWGQHPLGRAGDMEIVGFPAEEARQEILKNKEKFYPFITRMERGVSWLHADRGNSGEEGNIILVDP